MLVVVERDRGFAPSVGTDVVEVDDTLAAWGAIARAHLRRWRQGAAGGAGSTRTVAITGSAGKTTTKKMRAELLRLYGCLASAGNLNNRIGLPAVALEVESAHRFAVFEMGMSQPGEIAALAAIAEPDVGVITNVGMAHAGGVEAPCTKWRARRVPSTRRPCATAGSPWSTPTTRRSSTSCAGRGRRASSPSGPASGSTTAWRPANPAARVDSG